jgi:hypothetical protein
MPLFQEPARCGLVPSAKVLYARFICRFIGSTGHIPKGGRQFLVGIISYVQFVTRYVCEAGHKNLVRLLKVLNHCGQKSAGFATGNASMVKCE